MKLLFYSLNLFFIKIADLEGYFLEKENRKNIHFFKSTSMVVLLEKKNQ